jgi:mycothiol synthase
MIQAPMPAELVPPTGITVRHATMDDAAGVAHLHVARDAQDFGELHEPRDVEAWWREDPDKLAVDAWVALEDGRTVGYAEMRRDGQVAELADESSVHPDARGRGIGSHLLDLAEAWARGRDLPTIRASVISDDGRRLLDERGYRLVRHFWRMELTAREEPDVPAAPPGVEVRMARRGVDDRAVWQVIQDAFRDHWGWTPRPFKRWLAARERRSDYVPELWHLAVVHGEVAGAVLPFGHRDYGWVLELGVRERWRGRGIGLVLLRTAFRELWARGHTQIGLEVDAANETGATRLYERAGMRVTRQYDTYERPLEPA